VVGFVPLYIKHGSLAHLPGRTLRMRWPGTAETWLDGLIKSGYCLCWEAVQAGSAVPAEYRGARVFRCNRVRPTPQETAAGGQLVAVWESSM
jgi:hypothetical protein